MITSDVVSSMLRPASPGAGGTYRPAVTNVMSAALRAGVSYPKPPKILSTTTSDYEFPGDRTYQLFVSRRRTP